MTIIPLCMADQDAQDLVRRENKAIRRILSELKQWKRDADGLALTPAPVSSGSKQTPLAIDDGDIRANSITTHTVVKH